MRPEVKQIITSEVATLQEVSELLGVDNPALIYRFVVTEKACEYLRIGRSHIVIDREDIELVRERVARSNEFKAKRKANK